MNPLDRRDFVAMLTTSLGGLALGASAQPTPNAGTQAHGGDVAGRRPNVVLMICDDLGYGDLGCYGSSVRTPNLDRMASEGIRFTRFNTAHPICSASRSALLTGRYATRTGTKPVYFPSSTDGMNLDEQTIANLLHERHYRSMCVGKWHLGSLPEYLPTSRGFDAYFGVPYSVDMNPLPLIRDKEVVEKEADRALLTPMYTKAAVEFLEASSPEPFFLYMAFSYPHIPISASPRFKGRSQQGIYGDALEEIDWSVGQILETLQRRGLEEDTLVLFTSDHGPWFQGMPGPHRGRKGTTFEGGCRIPFLARWKGTIPAGGVCDGWACNLDVVPTLTSICGAKGPVKPLDGVDVSGLLTGDATVVERPDPLLYFSGMGRGFDLQCARRQNWKLRFAQYANAPYVLGNPGGPNFWLTKPELYNLEDDPGESYDVADEHSEMVKEILAEVDGCVPSFPQHVVEVYEELKKNPDSATTPAGAGPRPVKFVAPAAHYEGVPGQK
ncbi:MAG: sulfatase family protein [Acidobacteriaceae bacterium]